MMTDTIGSIDEIRLARAYLLGVAEPPAAALSALVDAHGPVLAAQRVREGNVPEAVAQETAARAERIVTEGDLRRAADAGTRLIIPEDQHDWPGWAMRPLRVLTDRGVQQLSPPLALWARGAALLADTVERAVTMVGSRAATAYGEYTAADWAYSLAAERVAVISGAAYGIDAAAHRGALAAEGVTIAVLGCALDAGYPAGHDGLLRRIAERGMVLSEYPPGTPPARHRFLVRNRLLAALGAGVVVVEADVRSGARNTARIANQLGKPVMAVPGPITSRTSAGCHELIREQHAVLVTTSGDVLSTLASQPQPHSTQGG